MPYLGIMKIVRILKSHYIEVLILILIIAVYFLFRLPVLTYQPIFADEAIYVRWAQVMKSEPTLRFLPLSDGKTPLFMWVMMPVFKIIADPLLAGRLLAVFSGLGTLIGIYLLGRIFFNKRVALFSALLVSITPYIVFFDRMALVDTMLAAFTVWSILVALLVVKHKRIDLAMILGFFLGGGLLTKTPAMLNVVMIPLSALTLNFSPKGRVTRVLKVFGLFIISTGIGLGIYNALRLGPGFSSLNSRNSDYVRNPADLLVNPLDPFVPHLRDLIEWWPLLIGYPVLIALVIGIIYGIKNKNRFLITIFLIALGPLVIQMALLRTFTARYMLFSISPFLLVAAYGIDNLLDRFKKYATPALAAAVLILLAWPAFFTYKLTTDIENAPLPRNERRGYLEDWTAGYGLREIARYLDNESKNGMIIIGTEGAFGTLPDGLQIYFDRNTNVAFKLGGSTVSAELRTEAKKLPTFFVANQARLADHIDRVELISRFPKALPGDPQYKPDATVLYRILP